MSISKKTDRSLCHHLSLSLLTIAYLRLRLLTAFPRKNKIPLLKKRIRDPSLTRNTRAVEPDSRDFYYTEKIGDQAVQQIHGFAKSPKPFFQYVAFISPHWPPHAREAVIEKYLCTILPGKKPRLQITPSVCRKK